MSPTGKPLYGADLEAHRQAAKLRRRRQRAALAAKRNPGINPRTGHVGCLCYDCLWGEPEAHTPRLGVFLGGDRE